MTPDLSPAELSPELRAAVRSMEMVALLQRCASLLARIPADSQVASLRADVAAVLRQVT